MLRKLKVVLDKFGRGSSVVDTETGQPIGGVRTIRIRAGYNKLTTVDLELIGVEVDAEIDMTEPT